MAELAVASIAFNKPALIEHQIRLFAKYLRDDYDLVIVESGGLHHEALNGAARMMELRQEPYFGFVDHDIFPTRPTRLIPLIEDAGFYGVGQRHAPTGRLYLWPGFILFSREWLDGRPLDFTGIRGDTPKGDGDTGSGLWPLYENEDWEKLYRAEHGYRVIREPDQYGLQSYGYEVIGDWIHLTNGSGWMNVPDPDGRERILMELLESL